MPLSSGRVFDYSDDAAVAKLLADEAKASSTRYATQGLSALLPKRTPGTAPKPNTRFLKNLVRDTDQHNAALRRKEDRERVERLRNGGLKSRNGPVEARERTRNGQRDDRHRDSKRGKVYDEYELDNSSANGRGHHRTTKRASVRSESRSSSDGNDGAKKRHRDKHRPGEKSGDRGRHVSDHGTEASHRKHKRRRSQSRSHSPTRDRHRRNSTGPDQEPSRVRSVSSSDPLEDLIGPLPRNKDDTAQVRYRGRGAHKLLSTSNIDAHFSSKYDPSLDVQHSAEDSDEKEDWDMALEALRDRQAWQKKSAERLRAAGFNDEEIRKWEDSGREKDIRDVQWQSKGKTREWDVGKLEDEREGRLTP